MQDVFTVVSVVVSFLIGSFLVGTLQYRMFKQKLHEIREAIDAIDDSLSDDVLTNEEIRKIIKELRDLI